MSRTKRKNKPKLGRLVSTARSRNHNAGPLKVRFVADTLRGLTVRDAQARLTAIHRPSSVPMLKRLLKSAVANANQGDERFKPEELVIGEIYVDGGRMARRFRPAPMGRAVVIRKRSSHVTVNLYAHPKAAGGAA